MKKEHNYVTCHGCKWQIEQNIVPDRDWEKQPCPTCHNTRLVVDPREILCNMCGECMCPAIGTMNEQVPHGLYKAKVTGGYDSYHLFDCTGYTFSFCEKCLRQLFVQCKIKPQVNDLGFGDHFEYVERDEQNWEDDLESYEYRVWSDNGGHHQAYLNRKCNAIKDCPNTAIYTRLHNDTEFTEQSSCEEHKETRGYFNSKLTKFIPQLLKAFL